MKNKKPTEMKTKILGGCVNHDASLRTTHASVHIISHTAVGYEDKSRCQPRGGGGHQVLCGGPRGLDGRCGEGHRAPGGLRLGGFRGLHPGHGVVP